MDPNEAVSYAQQLEDDADAVLKAAAAGHVAIDEAIEAGRKLAEAMSVRRSLGQIGQLDGGLCEMLLTAAEFGGESNPPAPFSIPADGLVHVVNGTVYDVGRHVGGKHSVEPLPDGARIVYRPRFGGLVAPLADDEARVELDRRTRWLAVFPAEQVADLLAGMRQHGYAVDDVVGWTAPSEQGGVSVKLRNGAGLSALPGGGGPIGGLPARWTGA